MTSHDGLRQLLARFRIPEGGEAGLALLGYLELLKKWGRRMSLTGSPEWPTLGPMFEEAFKAATLYPEHPRRHLDLGSGAGFPSLPVRILRPEMALDLVEARGKKAIFLETAATSLGLTGVRVHNQRIDEFLGSQPGTSWDTVGWKAIRLSDDDLGAVLQRAPGEIWVFHGDRFPGDESAILRSYRLANREPSPGRDSSYISVFRRV